MPDTEKKQLTLQPIILITVAIILALLFPIPFLLVFTLITTITSDIKHSKLLRNIEYATAANAAVAMSILLASRDYFFGQEVGFGSDMLHYAEAFEYIVNKEWENWQELMTGVIFRTGGGEPFFWATISAITLFTSDPKSIHIGLSLLGFALIFTSAELYNRTGALCLSIYFSTITCYAFQGSALRSGLAFSMLMLAISYFLKNRHRLAMSSSLLASITHFSMTPFLVGIALSSDSKINVKTIVKIGLTCAALIGALLGISKFESIDILQGKIQTYLSEAGNDKTSEYQFLIELTTMSIISFLNRKRLTERVKYIFIVFACLEIVFFLFFPTIFSRLYRYIYAIYFFLFLELSATWKPSGRAFLIASFISWNAFIVTTRYQTLFNGTNLIEHFASPLLK